MEFISKSLEETAKIANDFVQKMKPKSNKATIVGLYGELGSGKTTFMKYLAESLGIKKTIQSPTFVVMKIYKISLPSGISLKVERLIHIDAYRIEKEEEMINLGWNEITTDPKNLICVEWPDRITGIIPKHIMIKFEHVSENERKVSIT